MKKPPEEEGMRWLDQATEDLITARILFENERFYMVCYAAQQVAEKALKAYLYYRGEEIVTGHSIEELCKWAEEYDAGFAKLKGDIAILDGYYLPTRYPNALAASIPARIYNKKAGRDTLDLAEKTVEFVRKKMNRG